MPMPLSLVLVGDILTGRGVAPLLKSPQNTLGRYRNVIAGADLAWANLEAAPQTKRSGRKPFYHPGDLETLRAAGFDGLNLANNHSLDAGEAGAKTTQLEMARLGLKGAGLSLGGANPVALWRVNGRRVALVCATQWGPFVAGQARLRRLEVEPLARQIRGLCAQNVFVVASLHWGQEGVAAISPEQRRVARALIDAGALAVWGHHSHVAGAVESWKNRPIFGSTGNFLWDTMITPQSGLLVRLQIGGDNPGSAKVSWTSRRIDPQVRRDKAPPTPRGETRIGALTGRFDADNSRASWIVWTNAGSRNAGSRNAGSRPVLRALEQIEGGWRVRATGFPRFVSKIEVGDLNGDGRDELVAELRQRSKLDPEIKPRLHVYDLSAQGFQPLWRGSQLSRPFFEWTLVGRSEGIGRDLAALERGQNGAQWLTLYKWNGFGLRVAWQRRFDGRLRNLQSGGDARGAWLSFEQDRVRRFARFQNGWRVEEAGNS